MVIKVLVALALGAAVASAAFGVAERTIVPEVASPESQDVSGAVLSVSYCGLVSGGGDLVN